MKKKYYWVIGIVIFVVIFLFILFVYSLPTCYDCGDGGPFTCRGHLISWCMACKQANPSNNWTNSGLKLGEKMLLCYNEYFYFGLNLTKDSYCPDAFEMCKLFVSID